MNIKYMFHPKNNTIEKTEQFYSLMASQGWILKKRGFLLSKFIKSSPKPLNYQIVLCTPNHNKKDTTSFTNRIDTLKDWDYITNCGSVFVFSTVNTNNLRRFYCDTMEQKKSILASELKTTVFVLPLVVIFLGSLIFANAHCPTHTAMFLYLYYSYYRIFLFHPSVFLLFCSAFISMLFCTLYHWIYIHRFRHAITNATFSCNYTNSNKSHTWYLLLRYVLSASCIVLLFINLPKVYLRHEYDMPLISDGPYLLLKDIGFIGERKQMLPHITSNTVEKYHSCLTQYWNTSECISVKGDYFLMIQEVYHLKNSKLAQTLVTSLLYTTSNPPGSGSYTKVSVDDLDQVYIAMDGFTYIITKDNLVYYIYLNPNKIIGGVDTKADQLNILNHIVEEIEKITSN